MTQKMYAAVDKVSGTAFTVFTAVNDGMAVRNNMPNFWRILPKNDVTLYQVGSIDDESLVVVETCKREVDVDNAYKFPEIEVKNDSTTLQEDLIKFRAIQTTPEGVKARQETFEA